MRENLTHERLRECLVYDRGSGLFTWLISKGPVRAGSIAGSVKGGGYVQIVIDGRGYNAHRLAWFYETGVWPSEELDHENVASADNGWENLREASRSQNAMNRRRQSNNKSGFKGVSWQADKKAWRADIMVEGRGKYLGRFKTAEEAHGAYLAASARLHGGFARAG